MFFLTKLRSGKLLSGCLLFYDKEPRRRCERNIFHSVKPQSAYSVPTSHGSGKFGFSPMGCGPRNYLQPRDKLRGSVHPRPKPLPLKPAPRGFEWVCYIEFNALSLKFKSRYNKSPHWLQFYKIGVWFLIRPRVLHCYLD